MKFDKISNAYLNIIRESEADVEDAAVEAYNLESLKEQYLNAEKITKDDIINLLRIAVNDELLASFNYMISYNMSKTEGKVDFDPEFEAHEKEELDHAHTLNKRIREMGAVPLTTPWCDIATQNSCGVEWAKEEGDVSTEILKRRYDEELKAIEFYSFILDCLLIQKKTDTFDSTTQIVVKKIKAEEERHALDLRDLLIEFGVDLEEEEGAEKASDEDEDSDLEDLNTDEENDSEDMEEDEEGESEDMEDDIEDDADESDEEDEDDEEI